MNGTKRQRDTTLKDELPRLVSVQYATGEEQKNGSKKNEEMEPKQKRCPVVGVHGGESAVRTVLVSELSGPGPDSPSDSSLPTVSW